jgi:hypothetical protein
MVQQEKCRARTEVVWIGIRQHGGDSVGARSMLTQARGNPATTGDAIGGKERNIARFRGTDPDVPCGARKQWLGDVHYTNVQLRSVQAPSRISSSGVHDQDLRLLRLVFQRSDGVHKLGGVAKAEDDAGELRSLGQRRSSDIGVHAPTVFFAGRSRESKVLLEGYTT